MPRQHNQIATSQRYSPARWHQLIEAQSRSGLSQRAFCEQEQISYASFGYWRKKVRDGSGQTDAFVLIDPTRTVDPVSKQSSGLLLRLELGGGVVLELTRQ